MRSTSRRKRMAASANKLPLSTVRARAPPWQSPLSGVFVSSMGRRRSDAGKRTADWRFMSMSGRGPGCAWACALTQASQTFRDEASIGTLDAGLQLRAPRIRGALFTCAQGWHAVQRRRQHSVVSAAAITAQHHTAKRVDFFYIELALRCGERRKSLTRMEFFRLVRRLLIRSQCEVFLSRPATPTAVDCSPVQT